ncbi:hypothetical protein [Burkholderia vietnamiensis]|uniref:hypothetical protein n=1 Tax=Burkholderia vietnamiensis TaxID=60552 RepID=UPI001CF4BA83|nr:hypothetical protein [Burkholderia vietnamiensis]MCA8197281.1 hypothetical protein [Burkholderia vietnamiensis]
MSTRIDSAPDRGLQTAVERAEIITARVERRSWYVDGKYLGNASPWIEVDPAVIGAETTGNFYGEWQGTRFHDGHKAIAEHIAREIENRAMLRRNHPEDPPGERWCHPCRLGDWGEYVIITNAVTGQV